MTTALTTPIQLDLFANLSEFSRDYQTGYQSGLTWDANWIPGGPDIRKCTVPVHHVEYNSRMEKEKRDEFRHAEWMAGFYDGLAIRMTDQNFKEWWDVTHEEYKTKQIYRRY